MMYRTIQGDVLDAICARYYGVGRFDIATVYEANPGLADHGPHLPKGTLVSLPDQSGVNKPKQRIRLWD